MIFSLKSKFSDLLESCTLYQKWFLACQFKICFPGVFPILFQFRENGKNSTKIRSACCATDPQKVIRAVLQDARRLGESKLELLPRHLAVSIKDEDVNLTPYLLPTNEVPGIEVKVEEDKIVFSLVIEKHSLNVTDDSQSSHHVKKARSLVSSASEADGTLMNRKSQGYAMLPNIIGPGLQYSMEMSVLQCDEQVDEQFMDYEDDIDDELHENDEIYYNEMYVTEDKVNDEDDVYDEDEIY